jgi:hypothetical protein
MIILAGTIDGIFRLIFRDKVGPRYPAEDILQQVHDSERLILVFLTNEVR